MPRSTQVRRSLTSTGIAVVLLTSGAVPTHAQRLLIGGGVSHFVGGGMGIAGSCLEGDSRAGLTLQATYALTSILAAQGTARFHWPGNPTCFDGFPPPDGTYIDLDRRNLLAHSFAATDIRLRLSPRLRVIVLTGATGGGVAWRGGNNVP
jgi:hypothetical protein